MEHPKAGSKNLDLSLRAVRIQTKYIEALEKERQEIQFQNETFKESIIIADILYTVLGKLMHKVKRKRKLHLCTGFCFLKIEHCDMASVILEGPRN